MLRGVREEQAAIEERMRQAAAGKNLVARRAKTARRLGRLWERIPDTCTETADFDPEHNSVF